MPARDRRAKKHRVKKQMTFPRSTSTSPPHILNPATMTMT